MCKLLKEFKFCKKKKKVEKKLSIWKCINLDIVRKHCMSVLLYYKIADIKCFFSEGNRMAQNSHIPIYACQFAV